MPYSIVVCSAHGGKITMSSEPRRGTQTLARKQCGYSGGRQYICVAGCALFEEARGEGTGAAVTDGLLEQSRDRGGPKEEERGKAHSLAWSSATATAAPCRWMATVSALHPCLCSNLTSYLLSPSPHSSLLSPEGGKLPRCSHGFSLPPSLLPSSFFPPSSCLSFL